MDELKEKLKRAIEQQKIAVDSCESDEEKQYALGYLNALVNVKEEIISSK